MRALLRALLLTVSIAPTVLHAQAAAVSTQNNAEALFAKKDWAGAAKAYEIIAKRETTNGMAWYRWGTSLQEQGRSDEAIAPLQKALELKFQPNGASFRLARAYALKHDNEAAFTALETAASSGAIPLSVVQTQKDFDALHGEARWMKLIATLDAVAHPCRTADTAQQFDFWIGKWNVFGQGAQGGGAQVGTNEITSMLEHCALLENWTDAFGNKGKSLNFYDTGTHKWRQIWVADNGGSTNYLGEYRDGAMRFQGESVGPGGKMLTSRMTFTKVSADSVRQFIESSTDEGKTWTPSFDGMYVRSKM